MSSEPMGALTSADDQPPNGEGPDGVALLSRILEIEQQRIDTQNRRAEVALRMIDTDKASNKRQYDYGVKQLESNERIAKARLLLATRIAGGVVATVVLVFLAAFAMLFFGSDEQAGRAQRILGVFFTALGGGGLFYAALHGLRWSIGGR